MKRYIHLAWAHVRCEWYLFFYGMWEGQKKLVGYDAQDRVVIIAAVTPHLYKNSLIHRVFFPQSYALTEPFPCYVEFTSAPEKPQATEERTTR